MIIYRNGIKIASHDDAPSHKVNHKLSQVSPGTFQNKFGNFDDQGAQSLAFVKNIKCITGIDIDIKKVDVDHLGSCDVTTEDGDVFVSIESHKKV